MLDCKYFLSLLGSKRTWLKHGVLPTQNLPQKSHPKKQVSVRREIFKHEPTVPSLEESKSYSFEEHKVDAVGVLPRMWFNRMLTESSLCLVKHSETYSVDEFKFIINSNLSFVVFLFGKPVPSRSITQINLGQESLIQAIEHLNNLKFCTGFETALKPCNWINTTLYRFGEPASSLEDLNSSSVLRYSLQYVHV